MPEVRDCNDAQAGNRIAMHIAIASGKGGTGKTTVATNLAYVISQQGQAVTYADCDVEEPNGHLFLPPYPEELKEVNVMVPEVNESVCTLCGECTGLCEYNALAVMGTKLLVFASLCHSCGACVTLCPPRALYEKPRPVGFVRSGPAGDINFMGGILNVGEAQAPPVTKAVKRRLPGEGICIIDAPPGTSCPVIEAVRGADYVVLVTEPTPFGLSDLKLAAEMLRALQLPFGIVINRCDIGDSLIREYGLREDIPVLLELPFSRRIAELYATGQLAAAVDPVYRRYMLDLFAVIKQKVYYGGINSRQR